MTQAPYFINDAGEVGCHSSPVYVITKGGIETRPLNVGGMPTPLSDCEALCGIEEAHWRAWTLPRVAEIMQRIVPFASTWCAPSFAGSGCLAHPWIGKAGGSESETALIRSTLSGRDAIETAYHEAYHLIEEARPGVGDVLDGLEAHAVPWPNEYLSRPWERRARLFESFAMHLSEGGAIPLAGAVPATLGAIYSGEVGRMILASREPPRPGILSRAITRTRELVHA